MRQSNTNFSQSKTDVIAQEFKLYIEGVQVPFIAMSVSSGIGTLPSASIQVPPMPGLLDISKFYSPKVHIFYTDRIDGLNKERLLFSGIITGVSYAKSIDASQKYIEFSCQHKYSVMNDLLLDYTGWMRLSTNVQEAIAKPAVANSYDSMLEALRGIEKGVDPANEITEDNPEGDTAVLPEFLGNFKNRLVGIPGVIVNYWQQIKRDTFNPQTKIISDSFVKLYKPLVEDGLKFFQRLGGHFFIEDAIEKSRDEYKCKDGIRKTIIPPSCKLFFSNAVQTEMSFRVMQNYMQSFGEVTSIYQVISGLFESMEYELITLASPAEAANTEDGTTYAVDTIAKPKTPFYYSPTCNVLLPGMYTSIQFTCDDYNIPTRIEARNDESPAGDQAEIFNTYFRAPHSIRAAVAGAFETPNLASTISTHKGKVGVYEQGRGIKTERPILPRWLALFSQSRYGQGSVQEDWPSSGPEFDSIEELAKGWNARYPGQPELNPWARESGVQAHHRILFSATDYYLSQFMARSKAGSVQCPFNPYLIAGYPMDILEASPTDPSFHAFCTSVTHTITAASVSTSVSFAGAVTYSELANYYVPFVHPWLQVNLGLSEKNTIVANEEGKNKANLFYNNSLGTNVMAAAPEDIYDFQTGMVKPLDLNENGQMVPGNNVESRRGPNGGELNLNLTYEGNMRLVYREIESKESIEERDGVKFINLETENYNSTVFSYSDDVLEESQKLEIGQSQFLTYEKYLEL